MKSVRNSLQPNMGRYHSLSVKIAQEINFLRMLSRLDLNGARFQLYLNGRSLNHSFETHVRPPLRLRETGEINKDDKQAPPWYHNIFIYWSIYWMITISILKILFERF